MNWRPISAREQGSKRCDQCGLLVGLTRDNQGNVFCTVHRYLHDDTPDDLARTSSESHEVTLTGMALAHR